MGNSHKWSEFRSSIHIGLMKLEPNMYAGCFATDMYTG